MSVRRMSGLGLRGRPTTHLSDSTIPNDDAWRDSQHLRTPAGQTALRTLDGLHSSSFYGCV